MSFFLRELLRDCIILKAGKAFVSIGVNGSIAIVQRTENEKAFHSCKALFSNLDLSVHYQYSVFYIFIMFHLIEGVGDDIADDDDEGIFDCVLKCIVYGF